MASPFSYARVGIIVPRYRHTVVERNTLRRRLRELARVHLLPCLAAQDVLLRANPGAYSQSFDALRGEVAGVAEKLARSQP